MRDKSIRPQGTQAKGTFRIAGIALALLCGIGVTGANGGRGTASAAGSPEPGAAKRSAQAWPANVHLVEARLAPKEFENPKFRLELPQLRIYDGQGRLLYDKNGYEVGQVAETLRRAKAAKPVPGKGENPLAAELKRFQSPEGRPLAALPGTDLRIVEWWAEWCAPCHAQAKELAEALAKTPQTKVALVHVDANRPGFSGKKIVLDDSKLTPEMIRKLTDPNTPAAEKQKIIEAAQGKGEGGTPPFR